MPTSKKQTEHSSTESVNEIDISKLILPISILLGAIIVAMGLYMGLKEGGGESSTPDRNLEIQAENTLSNEDNSYPIDTTTIGDSPIWGNEKNAKIAIVEFADYTCSYCKKFAIESLPSLQQNILGDDVIYVYRDLPILSQNSNTLSLAGKCIQKELGDEIYFKYHKALFESSSPIAEYLQIGVSLGMNKEDFTSCVDSQKYIDEVQNDSNDANKLRLSGTPGFVIGYYDADSGTVSGALIPGFIDYGAMVSIIDELKAGL